MDAGTAASAGEEDAMEAGQAFNPNNQQTIHNMMKVAYHPHNNPEEDDSWEVPQPSNSITTRSLIIGMVVSGGFDVPNWLTSMICPAECRKPGHQEGYNCNNSQAYIDAGHRPSFMKNMKICYHSQGQHGVNDK